MSDTKVKLQVVGIDHVVLYVKDVERSKRFYIDVFGFEILHEGRGNSFLRCGTQEVALFECSDRDVHGGDEMNHMALRLEAGTYEEVRAALEGEGIVVHGRPGDDRCIYFDDPDGHGLQVLTPPEWNRGAS